MSVWSTIEKDYDDIKSDFSKVGDKLKDAKKAVEKEAVKGIAEAAKAVTNAEIKTAMANMKTIESNLNSKLTGIANDLETVLFGQAGKAAAIKLPEITKNLNK
ncbi:hypothetical protein [Ligilactobacillus sp. LYQ60]|uniref:hypothetical protein n=1 Tax=Ligilactobacillus sp. LYQ60 TaxID=3378799 RepID=UPI003851B9B1